MGTTTFFTLSSADISEMLEYVKGFISDITPLLIPIIAIGLGIIIFYAIVNAIRGG